MCWHWGAPGGYFWDASCMPLECFCVAPGVPLGCPWGLGGVSMVVKVWIVTGHTPLLLSKTLLKALGNSGDVWGVSGDL